MDVAHFDTSELFEIANYRAKGVAVEGITGERLGMENELAATLRRMQLHPRSRG
jgi:hypothetical protein